VIFRPRHLRDKTSTSLQLFTATFLRPHQLHYKLIDFPGNSSTSYNLIKFNFSFNLNQTTILTHPHNTFLLAKMPNRTHSNLNLPPPSPTCSLNYEKCTTAELRKFVEERTHTKLTEGQLQKVRDHGSYPLIDHLRQMDRENRFPRFMELV
jgi:hypothetical protein